MDNEGSKTISSQTTVSRGDPTHLLLGPTNALQVADQSLLALLQSLLQVLKGCTYLGQGLCLALLQLLADAPNQGDSCRQLWQSEEVKHLIPGWLEVSWPNQALFKEGLTIALWVIPYLTFFSLPFLPFPDPFFPLPRACPEDAYRPRTASSWRCRAALCCSTTSRSSTVPCSRCSPARHSPHMAVSQASQ